MVNVIEVVDATVFEGLIIGLTDLVVDLIPTVLPIASAILAVTLGMKVIRRIAR